MPNPQLKAPTGLMFLVPALVVCCLGPVLFTTVSIGGLSLLSGAGALLSVGIAILAAIGVFLFIGRKKRHRNREDLSQSPTHGKEDTS